MRVAAPAQADPRPVFETIADSLHAMCQPLTTLQCLLELGRTHDASVSKTAALHATSGAWAERLFEESLQECIRLNALVIAMRTVVQTALGKQ